MTQRRPRHADALRSTASQGGAGGAEICGFDVNGDGFIDAVGPMEGHGFGLAWWEQKRDANKNISFVEHVIMDNFMTKNAGAVMFTEPHAATCADMDGDGIQDLVTGKRYMSHFGYSDPDPWSEPVLYVFRTVRNRLDIECATGRRRSPRPRRPGRTPVVNGRGGGYPQTPVGKGIKNYFVEQAMPMTIESVAALTAMKA